MEKSLVLGDDLSYQKRGLTYTSWLHVNSVAPRLLPLSLLTTIPCRGLKPFL